MTEPEMLVQCVRGRFEVQRVPDFSAARLFLDRASAVRPDLTLDGPALDAVAVICRRLDGIPLALGTGSGGAARAG